MIVSMPADFNSAVTFGITFSGSDAPVMISYLYLSHTAWQFATSV